MFSELQPIPNLFDSAFLRLFDLLFTHDPIIPGVVLSRTNFIQFGSPQHGFFTYGLHPQCLTQRSIRQLSVLSISGASTTLYDESEADCDWRKAFI